jgi:hypothetical protein
MDRIANAALADPDNAHLLARRWAGVYFITDVEVIGETVVLYTGKDRGSYGFARVPGVKSDTIFNEPGGEDLPHFFANFPECKEGRRDVGGRRIEGDWFVVYDSYLWVKVGWS